MEWTSAAREASGQGAPGVAPARTRSFFPPPLARVDARFYRHARNQSIVKPVRIVDEDLYRDALHDLGEISGRVIGRKQGEFRPRGGRECLNVPAQSMSGKGIDGDARLLPNRHVSELRLLVVGNDPHLRERSERRDLAADAHQLAGLDLAQS